jgi:DNA-binding NarL/FixJ family response regulator
MGLQAMLHALIVEDNAAHRQSLHYLLVRQFPAMRITEAEDADSAFRQAMTRRFDLIFMDIRLPLGNGLDLTRIIKKVDDGVVICVITGYDILEYREAAFRNGADHFIVKGDSTETEIVGMVENLLHTRFISLIIDSDPLSRRQISMLLNIHWPSMIVAEAASLAAGLDQMSAMRPDLVLFELGLGEENTSELVRRIRGVNARSTLIGMTDEAVPTPRPPGIENEVDYCVSMTPFGHTELVTIVNSLHPELTRH